MKVAVIGATGNAGSRITTELLTRGHHVRAIVRSRDKIASTKGLKVGTSDLSEVAQLVDAPNGADAVVIAYRPPDDDTGQIIGTTKRIADAGQKNKQLLLVLEEPEVYSSRRV
jgi:putative NADH-flavin reductase